MRVAFTLAAGCSLAPLTLAGTLAREDFDGGAINLNSFVSNLDDDTLGAGDMFGPRQRGVLNPAGWSLPFAMADDTVATAAPGGIPFEADTVGIFGQNKTDVFFGVVDNAKVVEGELIPGIATWSFDISGGTGLSISIDAGAMGDFEASDSVVLSATIDGGESIDLFNFTVADDGANEMFEYSPMDFGNAITLTDPMTEIGSSVILDKADPDTGILPTFTTPIVGTGSLLELTLTATLVGGSEAFALDNILIQDESASGFLAADFNEDGIVNLVDLDILGTNFDTASGAVKANGDANGDGAVNLVDLDILGQQWELTSSFSQALSASGIAVPEPASVTLVAAGTMLVVRRRR